MNADLKYECGVEKCTGIIAQHTVRGGYRCAKHQVEIPGVKLPEEGRKDDFGKPDSIYYHGQAWSKLPRS